MYFHERGRTMTTTERQFFKSVFEGIILILSALGVHYIVVPAVLSGQEIPPICQWYLDKVVTINIACAAVIVTLSYLIDLYYQRQGKIVEQEYNRFRAEGLDQKTAARAALLKVARNAKERAAVEKVLDDDRDHEDDRSEAGVK